MAEIETFSTETFIKVFHNKNGYYVQVGPDRDGLELCEIIYYEGDKNTERSFTIPWEMASHLVGAITKALELR